MNESNPAGEPVVIVPTNSNPAKHFPRGMFAGDMPIPIPLTPSFADVPLNAFQQPPTNRMSWPAAGLGAAMEQLNNNVLAATDGASANLMANASYQTQLYQQLMIHSVLQSQLNNPLAQLQIIQQQQEQIQQQQQQQSATGAGGGIGDLPSLGAHHS